MLTFTEANVVNADRGLLAIVAGSISRASTHKFKRECGGFAANLFGHIQGVDERAALLTSIYFTQKMRILQVWLDRYAHFHVFTPEEHAHLK